MCGEMYFKPELLLMLKVAGCQDITGAGGYTDSSATADSAAIMLTSI